MNSEENLDVISSPPGYYDALLSDLLNIKSLPAEIRENVENLVEYPNLKPHPYRTYHRRNNNYIGELDYKCRKNGHGQLIFPESGNLYRGDFKKDSMDGLGCFVWAESGSVFYGQWRNNNKHGKGIFIYGMKSREKGTVFSGIWKNDVISGKGSLSVPLSVAHYSNRKIISGKFSDNNVELICDN